jgi:Transglycosylase-like domain
MRKLATIILTLFGTSACTTSEIDAWLSWWEEEPSEAEDFANQDWVQQSLEWGCSGPCDDSGGRSSASSGSSDEYDGDQGGQDTGGVYWPWTEIAQCESGGNWSADTGNGYYGGLQFAWGSWEAAGGSGNPAHASPSEQVYRAEILKDLQGYGAWPTCRHAAGV